MALLNPVFASLPVLLSALGCRLGSGRGIIGLLVADGLGIVDADGVGD